MKLPFFTIGHSNRSLEEFSALLNGADIGLVADIRKVPMSRTNPQFNKETPPDALAAFDISYEHMAALGGLREKARTSSREVNEFWRNESFHNYADYALTAQFHAGLKHPLDEGRKRALRDHVFGGSVMAMPPTHRRRLSYRLRGNRFPQYGARPLGACPPHTGRCYSTRRDGRLSRHASIGSMNDS